MKNNPAKPPTAPVKKNGLHHFNRWRWLYLVLLAFLLVPSWFGGIDNSRETTWEQFKHDMLEKGAVEKLVVVNGESVDVYIRKEYAKNPTFIKAFKSRFGKGLFPGPHYQFSIGSQEVFEQQLNAAQEKLGVAQKVPVIFTRKSNWFWNILGWIFPLLLLFLFWSYLMRRAGGGMGGGGTDSIFNFGKSTATLLENKQSDTSFDDVAGLEEAELEVREVVDFLKKPEAFTRLGAKIPKGVILVGPPGTGKTLLAKAVAGEAGVPFFSISGSEFVEMFVGVGASRVRDLFKRAKEKAPCIVFIDEIDAIGRSRGKGALLQGANDERESTLNQLLTEMDGFGTNSGVIVLAATNRADMLDPALLRPGRFDRHIYLELPSLTEREAIFKVHLRPLHCDELLNIQLLASQTPGFSGADIANICNEAALIAARRKKELIGMDEFTEAIDRVVAGLERKSKIIRPEEKRIIAFHEAGHALASWMLKQVDPLQKVSIIPRGKSLGAAWYLPGEKQLKSKTAFHEQLVATLAGRAAEELVIGEISSGALDDLEKASRQAYAMVALYGFNEQLGPVSFYDSSGRQESSLQKPFSEDTGRLIDEEVRKLLQSSYQKALALLQLHRSLLDHLAERIISKEVVMKEELEALLGKREDEG